FPRRNSLRRNRQAQRSEQAPLDHRRRALRHLGAGRDFSSASKKSAEKFLCRQGGTRHEELLIATGGFSASVFSALRAGKRRAPQAVRKFLCVLCVLCD